MLTLHWFKSSYTKRRDGHQSWTWNLSKDVKVEISVGTGFKGSVTCVTYNDFELLRKEGDLRPSAIWPEMTWALMEYDIFCAPLTPTTESLILPELN